MLIHFVVCLVNWRTRWKAFVDGDLLALEGLDWSQLVQACVRRVVSAPFQVYWTCFIAVAIAVILQSCLCTPPSWTRKDSETPSNARPLESYQICSPSLASPQFTHFTVSGQNEHLFFEIKAYTARPMLLLIYDFTNAKFASQKYINNRSVCLLFKPTVSYSSLASLTLLTRNQWFRRPEFHCFLDFDPEFLNVYES